MTPTLRLLVCNCVVLLLFFVGMAPPAAAVQQEGSGPAPTEPGEPAAEPEAAAAPAGETEAESEFAAQQADIEELERRIEVLAEELERMRAGEEEREITLDQARALGLPPSATRVYAQDAGVAISGYGEMLFENYSGNRTSQFDFLRAILYAGYRFNDRFLFNSELEIEHATEIFVEFAYVDFQATENFGLRAGMLLIPMGLVNEFHEPNVFMGAERPVTETVVIPSTWRENGGGVYFTHEQVAFRAYLVNGMNGSKFSSSGVRGGRQKGRQTKANDLAFTGRVDFTPTPGVLLGGSFYTGGSGQGDIQVQGVNYGVRTSIFEAHGQVQMRGFDVRALFAQASLDDTSELNLVLGLTGQNGVAETMRGGYVQFGYDVLSQAPGAGGVGLTPYIRYEKVDTQAALAAGFTPNPAKNNTYTTFGVELKPISNIVVKVDHMWVNNAVDTGVNQFNVAVGYSF